MTDAENKRCSKCGAENEVDSSFCKTCGADLHAASAKKPSKWWYLLPLLFGLLGGIIGYIIIKVKDEKMAKNIIYLGLGMFVLSFVFIAAMPSPPPAVTEVPVLTPAPTQTSTPKLITSTPKPTMAAVSTVFDSDKAAILTVKTTLSNQNFRDVNVHVADGRDKGGVKALMVSYNTIATTEADLSYETGAILGAYIGSIKGGADFDELMVIVGDRNGLAAGMWNCNKDWTNDYIDGRLSNDEILLNVLSTMTGL